MSRDRDGSSDGPADTDAGGKVLDFVHRRTYNHRPEGGYEWDREKARRNLVKHGVELADAALVLEDPLGLTMADPFSTHEERRLALGRDARGRLLAVVFVWRREIARLISARSATARERRHYEDEP